MGILQYPTTLFFIACSVRLFAQEAPPAAPRPAVIKAEPALPPEPGRLYWPGGLPPAHLLPPPGDPPVDSVVDVPVMAPDSARSVVDVDPAFPGGEEALRVYFQQHLVYPELARELGAEGKVQVEFVVRQDGRLTDVRIPNGSGNPELHQEAMRLVKGMPSWVPAQVNGSPVAAHASVLVRFRIRD